MTEHYYTKDPKSELKTFLVEKEILGNKIRLYTASGLFSKERLDKGSLLLIENAQIKGKDVLDLGCGYGVVGISIAKRYGSAVTFSDINSRAVEFTIKNCKLNSIKEYSAVQSDGFEDISRKFDHILLNPPQTAGKDVCLRLIEESLEHLNHGGDLQIVARHNKGGKTLSEHMRTVFGNLSVSAKSGGFWVYRAARTQNY